MGGGRQHGPQAYDHAHGAHGCKLPAFCGYHCNSLTVHQAVHLHPQEPGLAAIPPTHLLVAVVPSEVAGPLVAHVRARGAVGAQQVVCQAMEPRGYGGWAVWDGWHAWNRRMGCQSSSKQWHPPPQLHIQATHARQPASQALCRPHPRWAACSPPTPAGRRTGRRAPPARAGTRFSQEWGAGSGGGSWPAGCLDIFEDSKAESTAQHACRHSPRGAAHSAGHAAAHRLAL